MKNIENGDLLAALLPSTVYFLFFIFNNLKKKKKSSSMHFAVIHYALNMNYLCCLGFLNWYRL